MKIIKRLAFLIIITVALSLVFRGWLFRQLVTYKPIGIRTEYIASGDNLIANLNVNFENLTECEIEKIIELALSSTSEQLNFTSDKNDVAPNALIVSKSAHCVGYAAFFVTSCNYVIDRCNLSSTWNAKSQVAHLYFIGFNLHQYFNSPFFKDHDFAIIENKITGQIIAVDPSVHDYLHIDFVAMSN